MATKIPWAEETWNPIIGCSHISPGCDHCYAERMAARLTMISSMRNRYGVVVEHGRWSGITHFMASELERPLRWRKPRTIFVCSMGDLFHETVEREFIEAVFGAMSLCGHHTFLVLTKRPARMQKFFASTTLGACQSSFCLLSPDQEGNYAIYDTSAINGAGGNAWPLPNVWLGVTAEDQQRADERIPYLLDTPAVRRFVSIEPMLGPVDLNRLFWESASGLGGGWESCLSGKQFNPWLGEMFDAPKLDWVIAGCESGPGRRPVKVEWFRSLRDQCEASGVPFFLKQMDVDGKLVKMPDLDGRMWADRPEEARPEAEPERGER